MARRSTNGTPVPSLDNFYLKILRPGMTPGPGEKFEAAVALFAQLMTSVKKELQTAVAGSATLSIPGDIAHIMKPDRCFLLAVLLETYEKTFDVLALSREPNVFKENQLVVTGGDVLHVKENERQKWKSGLWTVRNVDGACVIS